jgi:GTP-binding protein EngB required for normal cell division
MGYREASKARTKVSILLMGASGVGKSSFILKLTESAIEVGHSLVPSKTQIGATFAADTEHSC